MDLDTLDSPYMDMRDILVDVIDKRIVNQEVKRVNDKEFIDYEADNRILKAIKFSLLMNSNETKFIDDINKKIKDMIIE